jgi:hypothetical protein
MTDLRLVVNIAPEPFYRIPTAEEAAKYGQSVDLLDRMGQFVRDRTGAAGTYVEIENSGTICNVDTGIEDPEVLGSADPWPPKLQNRGRSEEQIPRTGRPIVLLAVGGGDQEFDHWGDDPTIATVCFGQGARCEIPEPPAEDTMSLYAQAVFKRKPGDIRMGAFDGDEFRKGLTQDPPRQP